MRTSDFHESTSDARGTTVKWNGFWEIYGPIITVCGMRLGFTGTLST